MGLKEAQKYIKDHKKKQSDPFLWPDFMTGLPERAAIQIMADKYYSKLKTHCISYISIENIQPYLVKYGSKNHVDIIQWTAAILKTTADKYKAFIGVLDPHDFVLICKSSDFDSLIKDAATTFERKSQSFYEEKDLKNGHVLSFQRDGKDVKMGLMRLKYCTTKDSDKPPKERLLLDLERSCTGDI